MYDKNIFNDKKLNAGKKFHHIFKDMDMAWWAGRPKTYCLRCDDGN